MRRVEAFDEALLILCMDKIPEIERKVERRTTEKTYPSSMHQELYDMQHMETRVLPFASSFLCKGK